MFISCLLILLLKLKQSVTSFDCRLLANIDHHSNNSQYDSVPMDTIFSKCGVLPGQFLSNHNKHAVFYMNWQFISKHSFKIDFKLDFVENYSILNYYYSFRKFPSSDELTTNVSKFSESNELHIDSNKNKFKIMNQFENNLIFEFEPVPHSLPQTYDIMNFMYVICVMIVNLKEGTVFTMPFMCVDIFVDQNYYKTLKNESKMNHYGIVITLVPLSIVVLVIIAVLYFKFHKQRVTTTNTTLRFLLHSAKSDLLTNDLLQTITNDSLIKRKISNRNMSLSNRRFSRYELQDDCDEMPSNEEIILAELKTRLKPELISRLRSSLNLSDFDEFYV